MTWNVEWKPQKTLSALMGDLKYRAAVGFQSSHWALREKMSLLKITWLKNDVVRRKSRAIIKLFFMQISEQILLLNHSYPPTHRQHYYPLTLAFYLWPSLSLFICPPVFPLLPPHLPFSGIFSLQTNLQPNSHPILISPLLQCSFPRPLARVDRCRERKGGDKAN